MLDKDYDDRTRRVLQGPVFVPMWWGRYDPTYTSRPAQTGSGIEIYAESARGPLCLPGADIAAQMVTGANLHRVVGNVNTFTEKSNRATNPPQTTSSGRSRGGGSGGRSCACACACAGCARACAVAEGSLFIGNYKISTNIGRWI